jgi:hypothetical protein
MWFPNYKSLGDFEYTFEFNVKIFGDVTYLSTPKGITTHKLEDCVVAHKEPSTNVPKRDLHIYFRTKDMDRPSLFYKEMGDEIACMASFVPTFEQNQE